MSTTVTVAVAEPNHLPVQVSVQSLQKFGRKDAVWVNNDPNGSKRLSVGGAATFMVYEGQRLLVEECTEK
jgi:hypothetical protein